MMTKEQLQVEFDKIIEERGLKFSSNLNPFDMFVLGYELSQQGLMSKLHLVDVRRSVSCPHLFIVQDGNWQKCDQCGEIRPLTRTNL